MTYDVLDNEELLRLALDAMNTGKDADSVVMLKTILEREPSNAYGRYLLAAQHAQMGLMDRAEAGFRDALDNGLELPMARFQLGQLLVLKGEAQEANAILAPLADSQDQALVAYARAMQAAAQENAETAILELRKGLGQPQAIPTLAADMQRLLASLETSVAEGVPVAPATPAASLYLSSYGRQV